MRCEDWAARLAQYIAAQQTRPFSYDSTIGLDCCSFVFGAVLAITGIDLGRPFSGRYRTYREAARLMRAHCGKPTLAPFIESLMAQHGFLEVPPLFAGRGDAVLVPTKARHHLGVMDLNGRDVLSVCEQGIARVPITGECRAWRIT